MSNKTTKLGYLGIDQYGNYYHIKKHPRKELVNDHYLTGRIYKMYADGTDGNAKHTGYVIGDVCVSIYQVHEFKSNNKKDKKKWNL